MGSNVDFTRPSCFTDVSLVAEDKHLYVNKTVLSLCSPVFNKMFFGDGADKQLFLLEKKYDDMLEFLNCIYPSTTMKPVSKQNVEMLLSLAEEFEVQSLKDRCSDFIASLIEQKNLNLRELVHYLVLSDVYKLQHAMDVCVHKASHYKFGDLKNEREFPGLCDHTKCAITSCKLSRLERKMKDLKNWLKIESTWYGFDGILTGSCYNHDDSVIIQTGTNCAKCRHQLSTVFPDMMEKIKDIT